MPKTIHLFRHGQTDWNNTRRLQGHTDIPLNAEGRKQALSLQDFFAQNPVDVFISSDLCRAQETAQIANQTLAKPFLISADFREVKLGEIEGLTHEQILSQHGEETWQRWQSIDPIHFDFSFKDGETAFASLARFTGALQKMCQQHDFTTAGLCTHGLMMRRFLHSLRPTLTEPLSVPNCSVFTIHWDEQKGFVF